MDYWMISQSGDSSDKSSLGGGLMKRKDPQQPALNYVGVPSIDEYSKKHRGFEKAAARLVARFKHGLQRLELL